MIQSTIKKICQKKSTIIEK